MKSYKYETKLKKETFTILKRGTLWATYVSCVLLSVVLLNSYFFDASYLELYSLQFKFIPLFIVLLLGFMTIKLAGFENVGVRQTYLYLTLLVSGWGYVLYGLALLSAQNMPGIESLADILVLVFALALFSNRNVMVLAIFPFLAFSAAYHSIQYSQVLVYPLTKFICFFGIILSGQKIISGWFFKAVSRNIEKKKLLQQFKRLAMIDGLTNISNRRHFDEVLSQEIKASLRGEQPLSMIMVDVDFFKPLNDSLGHQIGDKYLKKVASVLNSVVERPRDLVARYGGEEFVVALPDTDLKGAIKVAQKIKQAIADAELAHPSSSVSNYITVSQGIAQWHKGLEQNQLLEVADHLLYQAKSTGRDRYLSD
ncbi:membrane-associated sensor domain-containing protein [uncultured Shewanella sp.]|uniref:GGDEF domain-containing protein n=1 Tax=uncultured Shewanella sp. TaxID=173975 RepID=UPI002607B493|nr:membrane-associated sensor domain-containing protein [uncultured Shewanella sp.]